MLLSVYKSKFIACLISPSCPFTNSTGNQNDKFGLSSTLMNSKHTHVYTYTHTHTHIYAYTETKIMLKGKMEKSALKWISH